MSTVLRTVARAECAVVRPGEPKLKTEVGNPFGKIDGAPFAQPAAAAPPTFTNQPTPLFLAPRGFPPTWPPPRAQSRHPVQPFDAFVRGLDAAKLPNSFNCTPRKPSAYALR